VVASSETVIADVEGSKGTAQVIEIVNPQTNQTEYQVRHAGRTETFKSMGEAYITAKEKAGYKG
jgi:hypothetical protein